LNDQLCLGKVSLTRPIGANDRLGYCRPDQLPHIPGVEMVLMVLSDHRAIAISQQSVTLKNSPYLQICPAK